MNPKFQYGVLQSPKKLSRYDGAATDFRSSEPGVDYWIMADFSFSVKAYFSIAYFGKWSINGQRI